MDDPVLFVTKVIGATPDAWQVEGLREFHARKRATIAGCNGSGKDCLATWAGLWYLSTRPYARGIVTGPSQPLLYRTVWPEFKKWIDGSAILKQHLDWRATRVVWKEAPERVFLDAVTAATRYSEGTGEVAAEALQGLHGDHIIVILTESSGINAANWDAAESSCTRPENYMLAVGNPLRRVGRFYESHTKPGYDRWYKKNVSYLESSWTDRALMEERIRRYGADSAYCQVRCFGVFPAEGAPDVAVSWDLVLQAMQREAPLGDWDAKDLIQLGVDCARYGEDEAVIATRIGARVSLTALRKQSGPNLVGYVITAVFAAIPGDETPNVKVDAAVLARMSNDELQAREVYKRRRECLIVVDEAGLGGSGVVDPLRQVHKFTRVVGINNAWAADNPLKYESWDDEQWMDVVPQFLAVGCLPADEVLQAQLTTRKYEFTGKNEQQRRLEPKERLKKRGLASPDRAEAVMMAVARGRKIRAVTGGLQMFVA